MEESITDYSQISKELINVKGKIIKYSQNPEKIPKTVLLETSLILGQMSVKLHEDNSKNTDKSIKVLVNQINYLYKLLSATLIIIILYMFMETFKVQIKEFRVFITTQILNYFANLAPSFNNISNDAKFNLLYIIPGTSLLTYLLQQAFSIKKHK